MSKRVNLEFLKENKEWEEAVIVYKQSNFDKVYTEEERSYKVKSKAKFFNPNTISKSLIGDCLDGKDTNVRLDYWDWKVEYCYIIK